MSISKEESMNLVSKYLSKISFKEDIEIQNLHDAAWSILCKYEEEVHNYHARKIASLPSATIPFAFNKESILQRDGEILADTYAVIYNRLYELINQLYH